MANLPALPLNISTFVGEDGTITGFATQFSTAPFTLNEDAEIRRFCGFPAQGNSMADMASYRFLGKYSQFIWRINHLTGEERQEARFYLAVCSSLEGAYIGASDNLDTSKAAVWTHNPNEAPERWRQFQTYRRLLYKLISFDPNDPINSSSASNAIVI